RLLHSRTRPKDRDYLRDPGTGTRTVDVGDLILEELRSGRLRSKAEVQAAKLRLARASNASELPTDADLWQRLQAPDRERFRALLQQKPTRTASGVAVVTVQSSPSWCPH